MAAARHDVVAASGLEYADGHNAGLHRIFVSCDDGLHRSDKLCPRNKCVISLVRHGSVRALSFKVHGKAVGRCHLWTGLAAYHSCREVRPDMQSEYGFDTVQCAFLDHASGTSRRGQLLCGLKNQPHRAMEVLLIFTQESRRSKKDGNVMIVTAGMHDTILLRAAGQSRVLPDRQCIHIRPERNDLRRSGICI